MNLIRVTEIEPKGDLKLKIIFNDGLSGVLDFSELLTGSVFSTLKELTKFSTASVQYGTIVWSGDVDMAPEYLHTQMLEKGSEIKLLKPLTPH